MAVRRHHAMPFGAQLETDGRIRFRLWAPGAAKVDVLLEGTGTAHALGMTALPEGWFELATALAKPGSLYRFRIDDGLVVPDPASRCNPQDVKGPSLIIDPTEFIWTDTAWRGRPWSEAVIYELHVGTFAPEGDFAGVERRLDRLADLGVTFIELMPLAEFPGRRGWGYDGVLPFAPESSYGTPADLKSLVSAAHGAGIGVLLDVVYNHFGPEGNFLHAYAPQFFTDRHHTPWGAAINFDAPGSRAVRDFFIHNALYWLEEYGFDGLRFDAVHAICDDSVPDFLTELAQTLRSGPGRSRQIHLVLENGRSEARYLGTPGAAKTFDAQWNDDEHHCLHVILTGESDGYYSDYAQRPHEKLQRCLTEGFAYQGDISVHEGGVPRGEPSAALPPTAFVPFLQNHDQIGNRALGERLAHLAPDENALLAATAILLLAPSPPLLFMGEEWAAAQPFPYFCDFEPELAARVREGRRREFARFRKFADAATWATVQDPTEPATFHRACLDWSARDREPHARWLRRYRDLLAIRRREVVPLIPRIEYAGASSIAGTEAFEAHWDAGEERLQLFANLSPASVDLPESFAGRILYSSHEHVAVDGAAPRELPSWSAVWLTRRRGALTPDR